MWTFAFSAAVHSRLSLFLLIFGTDVVLGRVWDCRYTWAEIPTGAVCNVGIGTCVHFVL
jgi:hypothetical protein